MTGREYNRLVAKSARHLYQYGMEGAFLIYGACIKCGAHRLNLFEEGAQSGCTFSECGVCGSFAQVFSSMVLATEN